WLFGESAGRATQEKKAPTSSAPQRHGASAPTTFSTRQAATAPNTAAGGGATAGRPGGETTTPEPPPSSGERTIEAEPGPALLPIGERLVAGAQQETLTLPLENLRKHTVILAG